MQKEIVKYDDQFKRPVRCRRVGDKLLEGCKLFKIGGSDTVKKFLKQLHREDLLPKIKLRKLIEEVDDIKETDPGDV